MKILLLFPPDWLPSEPYLSLPSLTAVLRREGYEVVQKDINVEMYEMILSGPFLRHVQKRTAHELFLLRQVSKTHSLSKDDQALMDRLSSCTGEFFTQLTEDVKRAKAILRSNDFFDIDKLEWATGCIHRTMDVISLGYYPARICFPPLETDLIYKPYISSDVLKAVDDAQINIYRDVYHFLVDPVVRAERPGVVGISVIQKRQLIPALTFCKLIKERYPDIHITLGGGIITRIHDTLVKSPDMFQLFDSAVLYEGEGALLGLVNALSGKGGGLSQVPHLIYKDKTAIHFNPSVSPENLAGLPPPDFDGLPLEKYFVPTLILPYLASRGCYWGRCAFCDHSQGYVGGFRTKGVDQVIDEIKFLKNKYGNRHFHFTDESYPSSLFKKLSRRLIEEKTDIAWTTHLRFEKNLTGEDVWWDAARSGCKYLHFGLESGNERVLKLMGKATGLETIRTILRRSAEAGIWNHCMGFFGFPGETPEEAEDTIRFLHENREYIHSVGFMTFVLGKHSPVAMEPGRYGISVYNNPEWDLATDFYFTVTEGLGVSEALEVFEGFEREHDEKWDLRTYVREYIFLYVDYFKTNKLSQLLTKAGQISG